MFVSSNKVVAIAAEVGFFLLLFRRESTCTIVLQQHRLGNAHRSRKECMNNSYFRSAIF